MLDSLPVLGVCGWSGAGKTTLLEALLPRLRRKGLRVAVAKHDAHGLDVDRQGKDSDRLFRAGADVSLAGPGQCLLRTHDDGATSLEQTCWELARCHDLVLVEGHKGSPIPKLWLLSEGETEPPPEAAGLVAVLPRDASRPRRAARFLSSWLARQWTKPPVYACLLIGGRSSRMGSPKHLIRTDGLTWVERTVRVLEGVASTVAIVGAGELPPSLSDAVRLPDVADSHGPMAGLLAAMRWAPRASWLVAACDLPDLSREALEWLLAQRAPGRWAVLPRLPGSPGVEPLLALYDFRAAGLLEELAARGEHCPARITASGRVATPRPPKALRSAWRNVNSPEGGIACTPARKPLVSLGG